MRTKGSKDSQDSKRIEKPAMTMESWEDRLVYKSMCLAEEQLDNKTISSQVLTQLLKLGSEKQRLELEKLRGENKLLKAKTEQLEAQTRLDEKYDRAIKAFGLYSGRDDIVADTTEEDDDDEYNKNLF